MKRTLLFFILVFLLLLLLLTGCKEKECKVDVDCDVGNDCVAARCYKGECQRQLLDDCCDPDACSGKVVYPNPKYPKRTITAEYAERFCDNQNICVVGVQEPKAVQLFSEHPGLVAFELVSSVKQPYVLDEGSLNVTITLTDYSTSTVQLPIIIDGVQVLTGSELIGQASLDAPIIDVGQSANAVLQIAPTVEELESEMYVQLRVTYHYEQEQRDGSNLTQRNSFEASYNKQLVFINPAQVKS